MSDTDELEPKELIYQSKHKKKSRRVASGKEGAAPSLARQISASKLPNDDHHSDSDAAWELWVAVGDSDPVPLQVKAHWTGHELKKYLVKNEELSIQSPLNLIRLFADNSLGDLVPILPQHKLASNPHLHNGAFIHISLLTTPTPSPATSMTMSNVSYGTSSIDSLRAEIEKLKLDIARLMSSSSPVSGTGMRPALLKPVVAAPKQVVDTSGRDIAVNPAKVSVALASSDAAAIMARLDDLDTKLEYKNSYFEAALKDLRLLSATIRGNGATPLPPVMGTNRADALSNAAGGGAAARGGGGPVQLEAAIPIKNPRSTFESVHQGPVWALAKKDNTYLFSGSSDTNIQVWDLENQKPLHTLAGHKSIVHSMDIYQNTLISGSDDRTLKFWDIAETWKCTKTIRTNNVACVLKVASGCLFAGSFKCVKVWNLDTFEFVTNIEAHNHWVRALNITKGHLFTGGYNAINMYDIGTFKLLKTMTHLCGSIYNIVVSGHLLIAATYENSINVFDLRTFECIRSLPGHNGAVYSLTIANNKLYSGSYDNTIRVWDLSTFNCVQKCVGHAGSVEALEATSDGLVYSGSTDGLIKVWK